MLDYPSSIPMDAAQLCLEIAKARAIQARKAEFALASWNVQGYVQRVTLGMPALPGDPSPAEAIPQIEDTIFELEEALYEQENDMVLEFGDEEAGADGDEQGNILVILAAIGVVIQAIQAWRNRQPSEDQDLPAIG